MSKKRRLIVLGAIALLAALGGIGYAVVSRAKGPTGVAGKPQRDWIII